MKALTIRQPWAAAIAHGTKRIENRSWTTRYSGPLLIHAGTAYDPMGRFAITDWDMLGSRPDVRGAVVAVAVLAGVHPEAGCCPEWGQTAVYHWHLTDVRPLPEPIPAKGRLGLWNPSTDLLQQVRGVLPSVSGEEATA